MSLVSHYMDQGYEVNILCCALVFLASVILISFYYVLMYQVYASICICTKTMKFKHDHANAILLYRRQYFVLSMHI